MGGGNADLSWAAERGDPATLDLALALGGFSLMSVWEGRGDGGDELGIASKHGV